MQSVRSRVTKLYNLVVQGTPVQCSVKPPYYPFSQNEYNHQLFQSVELKPINEIKINVKMISNMCAF